MELNKRINRIIAITILYGVLLALPSFEEIQYTTLYYVLTSLSIPITIYRIVWDEKFEKRFYRRWHKWRKQGFLINVIREGLRSFVLMIVWISISQLFGNGRTPLEIVSKLSGSALVWILFLLLAFNLIVGIIA